MYMYNMMCHLALDNATLHDISTSKSGEEKLNKPLSPEVTVQYIYSKLINTNSVTMYDYTIRTIFVKTVNS